MSEAANFRLMGEALAKDGAHILDEMCEHFIEHAAVERRENAATFVSDLGKARMRLSDRKILIELDCPSQSSLDLSRNTIAEHLFYFAGEDPFELTWRDPPAAGVLPHLHEVTVLRAEDITPRMRRVTFACRDVALFLKGDLHVRLLVPPQGRDPVWPGYRADGRIAWPDGEDALLVRIYTIRSVDAEKGELAVDFFEHQETDVETLGADFARNARIGDKAAILGPGGGGIPKASSILLFGDESALPAIARIAAEVPAETRLRALIEVEDAREEQPITSAGTLDLRWLHRKSYAPRSDSVLAEAARLAIEVMEKDDFIWFACEKKDVRSVRDALKRRGHDKKRQYVAWYWERDSK
ncbi:MAG: DUF2218 domain-containing protein [Pseudomonadota bacterium]|nr:DUF2218 domain-containing protein [Pseudomonadota bacterium]